MAPRWAWFPEPDPDDDQADDPPDVELVRLRLRLWSIELELASLRRTLEDLHMSTTTTTRSQSVILKELNAARAKLRELTTAAEADDAKRRKQEARIDHARRKWQLERPGEPFDPESSYPPLVPHQIDADLHQRHHRQHYIIADLEAELAGRGGLDPLGA